MAMHPEKRQPEQPEDDKDRIDELESQVRELSTLVEVLLSKAETEAHPEAPAPLEPAPVSAPTPKRPLVEGVKDSVGRALGGEVGESLESRVGGIWLSRIVAVLFMTLMFIGGIITLQDDTLEAVYKIAIGYGVAAAAIGYGMYRRDSKNLFPQTILGSGMAAFYFTTYAGFFLESTRVFPERDWGYPALVVALIAVAGVAHVRRSQTAAGVSFLLIQYTVVLSLRAGVTEASAIYALVTCSLLAALALVFHLTHRWLFFSWGALIATQLTYIIFFIARPPTLEISDEAFFWYSNAFLTLAFCVFSIACITDARRTGEFRKTVAPMAGVNSFVFLALTWIAIREYYPDYEWTFRLGQTALLLGFTGYAYFSTQPRNYLFQIFAAKSFIVFTLALQAYLSHEWLLVAMAIECLALGFSYKRSGLVIFKVLAQGLLAVVFIAALLSVRMPGTVNLYGWDIPARWFSCVGVPVVFSVVAWFYEHFIRPFPPSKRQAKGQWFLADTWIDLSGPAMALLHTSAAALILMTVTIIDLGGEPTLPYILAGEGLLFALLGLLLRTPQVEVSSVLLIIAAHVSYHVFLLVDVDGFETQPHYVLYTSIVVVATFIGGYLWERYLSRIEGGTQWEHDALACVPYLAATAMFATLIERVMGPTAAPLTQMALAVALTGAGALTLLAGFRVSAVLALILASSSLYQVLYTMGDTFTGAIRFDVMLTLMLLGYAACERGIVALDKRRDGSTLFSRNFRTLIVVVAALVGLFGTWKWAPPDQVSLYWLGHSVGALTLGVVFRESRYRWTFMCLYIVTIFRFYRYDLSNLQPLVQFLILSALLAPGIIISWGYSEYRARTLRRLTGDSESDAPTQGRAESGHTTDG